MTETKKCLSVGAIVLVWICLAIPASAVLFDEDDLHQRPKSPVSHPGSPDPFSPYETDQDPYHPFDPVDHYGHYGGYHRPYGFPGPALPPYPHAPPAPYVHPAPYAHRPFPAPYVPHVDVHPAPYYPEPYVPHVDVHPAPYYPEPYVPHVDVHPAPYYPKPYVPHVDVHPAPYVPHVDVHPAPYYPQPYVPHVDVHPAPYAPHVDVHPAPYYPEPYVPHVDVHPAPYYPQPYVPHVDVHPAPYVPHVDVHTVPYFPPPILPPELPEPAVYPPINSKEAECYWTIVFKAVAGNHRSVFEDFTTPDNMNTMVPHATSLASPVVYRNGDILDKWDHMVVSKVKVEVFVRGILGTWFIFNGLGSTFTNWFQPDRLLASPYHDAKSGDFNFFSIEGDAVEQTSFLVNRAYADDCLGDCGYLAVIDHPASNCRWKCVSPSPLFVYSTETDACGVFNNPHHVGYGDRLLISVKTCGRGPIWKE